MARRSHMISEPRNARQRERDRIRSATRRAGPVGAEPEGAEELSEALADILASRNDEARSFFETAGIGWMLDKVPPEHFRGAFRDHYTTEGRIDRDRFTADLAIWPPIASRVAQIQQGRP